MKKSIFNFNAIPKKKSLKFQSFKQFHFKFSKIRETFAKGESFQLCLKLNDN